MGVGHPFDTVKVRLQTQPTANPVYCEILRQQGLGYLHTRSAWLLPAAAQQQPLPAALCLPLTLACIWLSLPASAQPAP